MANIEKYSVETLVSMLIEGKIDVNELNIAIANHRNAFVTALKTRPHLLRKVAKVNARHFIPHALKENPEYFLYLDKEQYEEDFMQQYLIWRLEKDSIHDENQRKSFFFSKSYDEKLIFQYNYVTPEFDELYYMDKDLNVPLSIRSAFKITLKLVKTLDFIEQVDVDVASLGENKIKSTIVDLVCSKYKAFLHEYIKKNDVGFYSICVSHEEIEDGFKDRIEKELRRYGLQVSSFVIKSMAIPKEIQNKVEDLAFQIRQQKAEADANSRLAQVALENYKAKMEYEEQNPNATHSLTEYEKDQALKRYLIKVGRDSEEEIDRSIKVATTIEQKDAQINKGDDVVPEIEPKKNRFKGAYITWLIISIAISLIVMVAGNARAGLIMLAFESMIFGSIAAFNRDKFKDVPVTLENNDEGDNFDGNDAQ